MSEAPQEQSHNIRLRTAVVVVSMLALPAAAVLGVKAPAGLLGSKKSEAKPVAAKPRSSPGPAAPSPSPERGPGLFHQAVAGDVVHSGGPRTAAAAELPHDAVPASANIDVAGPVDGGTLPHAPAQSSTAAPLAFAEPLQAAPANAASPSATGGVEQFTQIQQRLRALGATHYALETWGAGGQLYRFQCQMAAGHNAAYTRRFEATDTDALRTMQIVLEEVEAWKSGRLP